MPNQRNQERAEQTYARAYAAGKALWRYSDQPNPLLVEFAASGYCPKQADVVDFACGEGIDALYLASTQGGGHRVRGFDIAANAIERARALADQRRLPADLFVADMTATGLADTCADIAVAAACMGWILDDHQRRAFVGELARTLRPGGWLFFTNGVLLEEIRLSFPDVLAELRRRQGDQAIALWEAEERDKSWAAPSQRYDTRKGYETMLEAAGLRIISSRLDISADAWGCAIWARKV